MPGFAKPTKTTIIPVLRYRDAPAAIEWLCLTFGFEKHLVAPDDDGTIAHAQLSFGNGMIMLGSALNDETEFGLLVKQPDEIGGGSTQSAYVVVTDADAVYASAKAAGARIASRSGTKITAVAALVATTWKGTCGALAPMTRGER